MASTRFTRYSLVLAAGCALAGFDAASLARAQLPPPPGSGATDTIRRDLGSRAVETRVEALRRAGELAAEGKEYLPQLEEAARSGDAVVRLEAILALGHLGAAGAPAASTLAKIVGEKDAPLVLKLAALDAIRRIEPPPAGVRAALETALKDDALQVAAARALAAVDPKRTDAGKLADLLAKTLEKETDAARRRADGEALSQLGDEGAKALRGLLKSDSAATRAEAAGALGALGEKAGDVAGPLTALLSDKDATVRRRAAVALGEVGTKGLDALAALEKTLADADPEARAGAIEAFGRLARSGELPKGVLEKLGAALEDPNGDVAARAAAALEQAGPAALATLGKQLENDEARALAAAAIGQIAQQHKGKLPELESIKPELLKLIRAQSPKEGGLIPDETTRDAVLRTLAALAPSIEKDEKTATALREAVLDETYPGRAVAALAYAQVAGKAAVPTLRKTVNDKDPLLRIASALALLKLDKENAAEAPKLAAQLMATLEKDDVAAVVRERVLAALQEAGPKGLPRVDPRMAKTIADRLRDEDPKVRQAAIELLSDLRTRVDPPGRALITAALRAGRFDPDPSVRAAARNGLGEGD